jgi:hypothetical protein
MGHGLKPEGTRTRSLGSTEARLRNEGQRSHSEPTAGKEEASAVS